MTPEEIRQQLHSVTNEPLFATKNESIWRSDWKQANNGARFCSLYTVWQGHPLATPAICLAGQSEEQILNEAIARIEGHAIEKN